jgi:hypothetical protein
MQQTPATVSATVIASILFTRFLVANGAPHLAPPGRQAERKQNIQIAHNKRPESAGGD